MKIEASFTRGPFLKNLLEGDTFWHANSLYLKIAEINYRYANTHCGQNANAICLSNGRFSLIPETDSIQIAKVKIVNDD